MNTEDIILMLQKNSTKKNGGADIKIQYNKADITAIFRKSFCEKLGVQKVDSLHFATVEDLQKTINAISEKTGISFTIA